MRDVPSTSKEKVFTSRVSCLSRRWRDQENQNFNFLPQQLVSRWNQ